MLVVPEEQAVSPVGEPQAVGDLRLVVIVEVRVDAIAHQRSHACEAGPSLDASDHEDSRHLRVGQVVVHLVRGLLVLLALLGRQRAEPDLADLDWALVDDPHLLRCQLHSVRYLHADGRVLVGDLVQHPLVVLRDDVRRRSAIDGPDDALLARDGVRRVVLVHLEVDGLDVVGRLDHVELGHVELGRRLDHVKLGQNRRLRLHHSCEDSRGLLQGRGGGQLRQLRAGYC